MRISAHGISKYFGGVAALSGVNLEVPPGELTALLGPSGSGKTTLLRVIAGLEQPDSGEVIYGQDDVTHASARERNVGFVFQHYALFNHMTIFENIAFGLRVRKWKPPQIAERVNELLGLIQLENLGKRFPAQLSGGQRQRVALARALAPQPQVLLLDEPFGALDAKVRQELRRWLRKLHDEIHMTSLFVTHDQEEAFEVADRVVVMNSGRIEQEGSPEEVFAHPANAFVMDFLGSVNVFHGRASAGLADVGMFALPYPEHPEPEEQAVTAYVRPHELDLDREPHGIASQPARVLRLTRSGPLVKLSLAADGHPRPIEVELDHQRDRELQLQTGDLVYVYPRQARVFKAPEEAPAGPEWYI